MKGIDLAVNDDKITWSDLIRRNPTHEAKLK
jgi:hypothetical protein